MKVNSINILAAATFLLFVFLALNSTGISLSVGMLYFTIIIVTLCTYLLAMAKSYVNARMQESKISGDLEARIANLNEYMDKIESRIDKIGQMLEKV